MEIQIPEKVFKKVMHWVNKSNQEVSGFGKVLRNEDGSFYITDAYLLKQEVGTAHTDIDAKSLGKLMYTTKDLEGDLRWWWHSHVQMQVFWSGTDKETIQDLGKNGWIIASVFNQKEEVHSALCYRTESDFGPGFQMHDDIQTSIMQNIDQEEIAQWDKEFTENVSEKKFESKPMPSLISQASEAHWRGQGGWDYDPYEGVTPAAYSAADMNDPGLTGAGLIIEAKAIGMTVDSYVRKLNYGDIKEISKLENKLEYLMKQGKLNIGNGVL